MLLHSSGPRLQESECWALTNAKPYVVRRVSRSGSLRPVSTAQKVPPKKEPQESRRDRLERAITSFRTPARVAAQKVSSDLPRHSHPPQQVNRSPHLTALFLFAAATKSFRSRFKPGFRSNTESYKQLESL